MKITKRKITASTSAIKIPAPFDKYYDFATDAEVDEYTGYSEESSPCEDCEGYDVKHLGWAIAKPEYQSDLSDSALDVVEIISEGGDIMLAYVVKDRIYEVDEDEVKDALGVDEGSVELSTKPKGQSIKASTSAIKIPAPFDKYYTIISDEEVENLTGEPAELSPCEECEGYGVIHLGYAQAKPEYMDYLSDMGIADVELLEAYGDVYLGYCVHDRIYPVELSDMPDIDGVEDISSSTDIYGDDDYDEEEDAFGDDPVAGIGAMFSISYDDAERIFDWYDAEGITADFDKVRDFLDYIEDDIDNFIAFADDADPEFASRLRSKIGGSNIESCNQVPIESAVDTGLTYWYFTRHGMGPGTIPIGVTVLDWYEEGYKTWVLLDKMLTTAELNEYELKEQTPPAGVTTHNGDVIEGCSNVTASECTEVSQDDNQIEYVVSSTKDVTCDKDFIVDYKIPDDPEFIKREEQKRKAREIADENDAYDLEHKEGEYSVEGSTDVTAARDDVAIDALRDAYLDPDSDDFGIDEDVKVDERGNIEIMIPIDAVVAVDEDTSWKFEEDNHLDEYVEDEIDLDTLQDDFTYFIAWSIPSDPGRYHIKADVNLVYVPSTDLYGDPDYELDSEKSKIQILSIEPAGKEDMTPSEESVTIEESTDVECSNDPMMTEAELDDALLSGKPFDLASFKKYKTGAEEEGLIKADEVQVGDIIVNTEDASELNLGTKVEVLDVIQPGEWTDYVFHVRLLESPDTDYWYHGDPYKHMAAQPGDEMDLHFDADEYVGIKLN